MQGDQHVLLCSWGNGRHFVVRCMQQLKRTSWSWDWPVGARDSFVLPAEAFLGEYGRAGMASRAVGVMQPTGRPFGDVELALLQCQRLACVVDNEREAMRQVRDQGVLLCHLQKYEDAHAALARYESWVAEHPELVAGENNAEQEDLIQPLEVSTVHRLRVKLDALKLESCLQSS